MERVPQLKETRRSYIPSTFHSLWECRTAYHGPVPRTLCSGNLVAKIWTTKMDLFWVMDGNIVIYMVMDVTNMWYMFRWMWYICDISCLSWCNIKIHNFRSICRVQHSANRALLSVLTMVLDKARNLDNIWSLYRVLVPWHSLKLGTWAPYFLALSSARVQALGKDFFIYF